MADTTHPPNKTDDAAPQEEGPASSRPRRILKYIGYTLGGLIGLVLLIIIGALLVVQTDWGAEKVKNLAVTRINALFDGAELQVGTLGGNIIGHLALYDVNLVKTDGELLAHMDTLTADYRLLPLLKNRLKLTDIYLTRPQIWMEQRADSTWDLLSVIATDSVAVDTAKTEKSALIIELDQFTLRHGQVQAAFYAPERDSVLRVDNLEIELGDMSFGQDLTLRLDTVMAHVITPGSAESPVDFSLSGAVENNQLSLAGLEIHSPHSNVTGRGVLAMPSEANNQGRDLDFTLQAHPLSFQDIAPFVPALSPTGEMEVDMRVKSTASQLTADVEATLSDGATLTLTAVTTLPGESTTTFYRADGEIRNLDPSFFTGDPAQAGLINADLDVDLQGPAPEQVDGHANLSVFDTRYGEYVLNRTTLESTFTDGQGQIDLQTGLRGMALTLGGTLRPFDAEPSYNLGGRLTGLDIGRFAEGGTQHSNIAARISLEGRGIDMQTANLTARLDLAPSQINNYRIRDGYLSVHANDGTFDFATRLRLPEGQVTAAGDAQFGEEMRYRIRQGRFDNLDLAALSGDTTRSTINGTFSLSGVGTAPGTMTLQAQVNLHDSYYGTYPLDEAALQAGLRNGRLTLNGDADLGEAGSLTLAAVARPFTEVLSFEVSQARFDHIDIGALTQNSAQHSDLNGTLSLRGRGTDPATMALNARLLLTPSRINDQMLEQARLHAGLQRGALTYDASLELPEGQVILAGVARPFDEVMTYSVREGTFAGLNVGALAGNPSLQTNLNGSLALGGRGIDPKTMTLNALLRFDSSTINEAVLQDGRVMADVQHGQARLESLINLADGTLRLDAAGNFLSEEPRYEAHGSIHQVNLAALSGTDSLDARFSLGFDVEGQGIEPATMQLQGNLHAREGTYGNVRLDTLGTRFHLADGLMQIDSLLLRSNVADMQAGGQIALFDSTGIYTSDFRLDADITSLEPVREMINADLFSLRNGEIHATVQGPATQLQVEATAAINSLIYNTFRLAGFETSLAATLGPERSLASATFQTDLNYFSTPTLTVRSTHFESDYDGNEATFLLETHVDERRDTRFSGRIDPRPESRRIMIEDLGMRFDEDRWTLDQSPATIAYGNGYRFTNLTLNSGTQQLIIDGLIDPDGTQDFHLLIEQLRLGGIADLFGFHNLGGTLNTTLDLTGLAPEPLMTGNLSIDLLNKEQPAGTVSLDLNYADQRLNLDALLTHQEGSALAINGYIPFDFSLAPAEPPTETTDGIAVETETALGAADLRITSDAFAINWARPFLNDDTVDDLEGTLHTNIHVGGQMNAPDLDGTFALNQGRVGLPAFGVTYRDIAVNGTLENNNILLNRAAVNSGDGSLVAQGRINMPNLALGEYNIEATLDDFRAIDSDLYRSAVSGNLAVSGTTNAPIVSGDLTVGDTDIYLASTTGGDIRQVELTEEDVRMLEEYFGYRVSKQDTSVSDVFNALTLNMTVELERDTWIRQTANPEMAIELTGNLDIQKEPGGELLLFRSIEVIPQRSYIRQFGKRFDLSRGTITFNGPIPELMMDIGARYEVRSRNNPGQPEAIITLDLTGRLDDLNFALGSEPTMENADMVSYIATGRPAEQAFQFGGGDDSGEGGGLLTAGGGLAANQLAGVVEGLAGEGLGLDVIEIEQDGLRGTQIVAGKYVSSRVYVGINQPIALSSTENTPSGTKATEVTVEYEMFEWLLLQLLSGTATSSVRLNLMGKHTF